MPFVRRDANGKIISSFLQPQNNTEEVSDDAPEYVEYLKNFPSGFLVMTPEQAAQAESKAKKSKQEENEIHLAIETFNKLFSSLESALSLLLHSILNAKGEVAFAIYYSPTSFDARAEIVGNALFQIAVENPKLGTLVDIWQQVGKKIDRVRRLRNAIAHGSVSTLLINGKQYVRLSPPIFDVIRLGRTVDKGQVPGLSTHDISGGIAKLREAADFVRDVNGIVQASWVADPKLSEKCGALWDRVKP